MLTVNVWPAFFAPCAQFQYPPQYRYEMVREVLTVNVWRRAGVLNVTVPLTLSSYLAGETEYLPWSTALQHFRKLDSLLSFRTARRSLHCFVRKLITPLYGVLGWSTKVPHVQR